MKKTAITLAALLALLAGAAIADNLPYITKVFDFQAAPGQFANVLPEYVNGDTKADMIKKVQDRICGHITPPDTTEIGGETVIMPADTVCEGQLISLGAFGGYVVFGFDHPVVNVKGSTDFKVFGNAFQGDATTSAGGSSEPGIVMVSKDVNHNGLPDDPWYELAGSEYSNPKTKHNYKIVYYRPEIAKNWKKDTCSVRWTSNDTDSLSAGKVDKNTFHAQAFWPMWVDEPTLTFEGSKLPCNGYDESGKGTYWVQYFFGYGYVDNVPNTSPRAELNIEWAVDEDGKPVELDQIDFVKVYCAENQMCGWLGETSTEVTGAVDLHPNAKAAGVETVKQVSATKLSAYVSHGELVVINSGKACRGTIYSAGGKAVLTVDLSEGRNVVSADRLGRGVWIVRSAEGTAKVLL